MDIVEQAKEELGSGLVAYTEFVLDFKKESNSIYCFYEGKDDRSYYSFRATLLYDEDNFFDYICNGKENLLKLRQLINNHKIYSNSNIGYFVDMDFEHNLKLDDVYITPYYSVENFFVVDDAFQKILLAEFNMVKSCDSYKKSLELFKKCKNIFHQEISHLNIWLACQADLRIEKGLSTRLKIDEKIKNVFPNDEFDKIVSPNMETINFPNELKNKEEIKKVFTNAPEVTQERFDEKKAYFETLAPEEIYRGKFELRFLISFLNRLQDELGKRKNSIFPKRYSCNLRFEYSTGVSLLTNNAITPKCLKNYILQIKNAA